jgi:hypothetical protein
LTANHALEPIAYAPTEFIVSEGKSVVLKEQVASFFEITPRTVDNYIEKYGDELRQNGYEVIRGKRLKTFKLEISARGDSETDFVIKTNVLGIFDFRAFLNLAMLMVARAVGYLYCVGYFLREMENISYHVAAGKIGKELLGEIIAACLNEEMDCEPLKLKIFEAISRNESQGQGKC